MVWFCHSALFLKPALGKRRDTPQEAEALF